MDATTMQRRSEVPKLLLTIEQAAEAMGLGRTFMYDLVMRGEVCSIKVGRKRRVPVAALQEYVAREVAKLPREV